jgi:hypothetical protein
MAKRYKYTPEQVISIYSGENTYGISEANRKTIVDAIDKLGYIQQAPTLALSTGANEVVRIEGENYNPTKMWYSKRDGAFYLIVTKTVSAGSTTKDIKPQTIKLTQTGMKQLKASSATSKSVAEQLGVWNELAPQNGWPTIDEYIGGGASASKSTSAKTTTSGVGIPIADLAKKGLNIKDYVIRDGKAYPKK